MLKKKKAKAVLQYRPRKKLTDFQKKLVAGAAKIPASPPGYGEERGTSWISPGRYVMRNGSAAIVTGPLKLKFGEGHRLTWHGWKGHLDGHAGGEGLQWSLDGKRSDATPAHEHDLTKRHKNQKAL